MKVPTKVRYGLRAMIDLAQHYGTGPVLAQSISERQDISKKYLESLLAGLKAAGLVNSVRGSRGGYVLAKTPAKINACEIFESLDGPLEIVNCAEHMRSCRNAKNCVATELWETLTMQMRNVLTSTTLESLAKRAIEKNEKNSFMFYI